MDSSVGLLAAAGENSWHLPYSAQLGHGGGRRCWATGARVRKRTVETRDKLTPREAQIARLPARACRTPISARDCVRETA